MKIVGSIVIYKENINLVKKSIESFFKLKNTTLLIIIDNYGDKNIRNLCNKYKNIKYLNFHNNLGYGKAHNKAFEYAKINEEFDIFLVMNPDIYFDEKINKLVEWFYRQKDIGLVVPKIVNFEGECIGSVRKVPTLISLFKRFFLKKEMDILNYNSISEIPWAQGSFLLFKKDIFEKLKGFDERFFLYMEDVDIFLRAKKITKTVINPNYLVFHKWRRKSKKSIKLFFIHLISIFKFFWKYRNMLIKNFLDKLLAILLLPFLLIIHFIIYFLIKLEDGGPVIFTQKRFTKDGKIFEIYKYRSMYENGEEILREYLKSHEEEIEYFNKYHKYKNDPRITKIGKFLRKSSIDELPQIINILKDEMSFIGPRPYLIEEESKLGKDKYIILQVKPGLSGLWQVMGRNEMSFEKRKKLDKWYVKNWSLKLDFIIFLKTIKIIFTQKGAK